MAQAQAQPAPAGQRPNILVIWGDDVGIANVSAYSFGVMGIKTPNIDRIGKEGMMFTDYYAEQSCTAGRASFLTGQTGLRTGMTKVGLPAATLGLNGQDEFAVSYPVNEYRYQGKDGCFLALRIDARQGKRATVAQADCDVACPPIEDLMFRTTGKH